MKKILSVSISICVLFSLIANIYAVTFFTSSDSNSRNSIHQYLDNMSKVDSEYAICSDGVSLEYISDLHLPNSDDIYAYLYSIYKMDYIGYAIVRATDYVVIESALADNPYSVMSTEYRNAEKLIYDHYDYGIQFFNKSVEMMSGMGASVSGVSNVTSTNDSVGSLYNVGNVAIYSQGSFNCIACAVGHLLLYWDSRCPGFTRSVTSQADFERLLNTVYFYYQDYDQDGIKFDNDDTPRAIAEYAAFRSNNSAYGTTGIVYAVRPNNVSYPTFSQLSSIIGGGSPVLLGYKAGSVYSQTVGHMTMCIDAYTSGGVNYVKVVDGHVLAPVTRAWSNQYNDYMMTLNVSIMETQ